MSRLFVSTAIAAALAVVAFSQGANATTISLSETFTGDAPQLAAPTAVSFTPNFKQGQVGSIGGQTLSPYAFNSNPTDETTFPYDVLAKGGGGGTAIFNVAATSFKFLWGSPDVYNQMEIYSGLNGTGTLITTILGSDLACYGSSCHQTLFDYIVFTAVGGTMGSIRLIDTGQAAFEFGLNAVPLPGALPLFAGGLGLLGLLARRRKKKVALSMAAA